MTPAYIWSALAVLGVVLGLMNASDAAADLAAVEAFREDGARRLIARWSRTSELIRVGVKLLFVAIGIVAILGPHINQRLGIDVIQGGLIAAVALLDLQSLLARLNRQRLRRYFDQQEAKP